MVFDKSTKKKKEKKKVNIHKKLSNIENKNDKETLNKDAEIESKKRNVMNCDNKNPNLKENIDSQDDDVVNEIHFDGFDDSSNDEFINSNFSSDSEKNDLFEENGSTFNNSTTSFASYFENKDQVKKKEIDPVFDSDDSNVEEYNTIGNIPISAYDDMPHIGYDINGRYIMRPAKGSVLDEFLESIDLPETWTGLTDKNTGLPLKLTSDELEIINKISKNEHIDTDYNPYEKYNDWFTSNPEVMPLSSAPEPKRRFIPSKNEAIRIAKIVKAIKNGWIISPNKMKKEKVLNYDLWSNEFSKITNDSMILKAPKLKPPTNEESYNPPEEYLFNEDEKNDWLNKDIDERETNFIPQKYNSLRKVPAYHNNLKENFERSLDLYLAPRVLHNKLDINPNDLIPNLPSPQDLKPFPTHVSVTYEGHKNRIRSLSVDPLGLWLATGSDDGYVFIWEVLTGRILLKIEIINIIGNSDDHIERVEWCPDINTCILAVTVGSNIYLIVTPVSKSIIQEASLQKLESGWGHATFSQKKFKKNKDEIESCVESNDDKEFNKHDVNLCKWTVPTNEQKKQGIYLIIQTSSIIKNLSWHKKGDYFVTLSQKVSSKSVLIHQISKHFTQSPFKNSKGIVMDTKFHPFKPQIFVASQRSVRIYDLVKHSLVKKLNCGVRFLSKIDLHPKGEHLLACSYDKRVLWHDLDLSSTPYKILRYHQKPIRSINFHKSNLPLFASGSDDGDIHVFYGMVYDDLMSNPLLVPLKKLCKHKITNGLGVSDLTWHPHEPWLFSSGSDGIAYLWTT